MWLLPSPASNLPHHRWAAMFQSLLNLHPRCQAFSPQSLNRQLHSPVALLLRLLPHCKVCNPSLRPWLLPSQAFSPLHPLWVAVRSRSLRRQSRPFLALLVEILWYQYPRRLLEALPQSLSLQRRSRVSTLLSQACRASTLLTPWRPRSLACHQALELCRQAVRPLQPS